MNNYISFLRGINISGQKIIKMVDLRELYLSIGLENVKTYIQSGNVIFHSKIEDTFAIKTTIELAIEEKYGFFTPVIIRSKNELNGILKNNPFQSTTDKDNKQPYVTILEELPHSQNINQIRNKLSTNDELLIIDKEIYIICENGYGHTLYSNNFFEKQLNMHATTRNWKTLNKLNNMFTLD